MDKPDTLIEAIEQFIELVVTDPRSSDECRKTGRKLLSKIGDLILLRDSLAATRELSETRRALLKEYQHIRGFCVDCEARKGEPCTPDCAIAPALKGVGGE